MQKRFLKINLVIYVYFVKYWQLLQALNKEFLVPSDKSTHVVSHVLFSWSAGHWGVAGSPIANH